MANNGQDQTAAQPDDNSNFASEGDTVYKDGIPYVVQVQNGQLVPIQVNNTGADVAKSILPGIAQGLEAVKTAPASLASLAATGVGAAAQKIPQFPGVPEGTANAVSGAADKVNSVLQPYTYGPEMSALTKQAPELGYEAQTIPGKLVENAGRALPSVALGGEGALPTISRTLGSAAGATGGDWASGGSPWGQMAGALLGYGGAPTGVPAANDVRGAWANTLEQSGVPVSAAERTGSRVRATLEGQSPGDRTAPITAQMLKLGGIPQPTNQPLSQLISQRTRDLGTQANTLEQTTSLPVSNNLWNTIGNIDLQHTASGTGATTGNATSLINPEVHQAYTDFSDLASGGRTLTGKQYRDFSQKWNSSDVPEVRKMGQALDTEMQKAHPEWEDFNTNWANLQGLKAASEAAGGTGTTAGLNPSVVRSSMYKQTPLRDYAEAAEGITGSYPKPYSMNAVDSMVAALGGVAGAMHGSPEGAIAGAGAGSLLGGLHVPSASMEAAINPLARSAIGQKYLMINPKAAAAALYGQSSGAPLATPEGVVQK
jgi:hypothetical protein